MTERKLVDDPDLQPEKIYPVTVTALLDSHPELRPVVVDGLLREGETANVIAPPKTGKSFLAGNLAWCVADGRPWLSHDCQQGRVLVIDNELHPETLANRLTRIADAMQIPLRAREQVEVISPVSVCYEYPLWNATTLAPEVKTANRGQEKQQKNNAEADRMIEKILKAAKTPMSTSDLRRETGMGDQRISGSLFRLGENGCVKSKSMKSKKTGKRCQRFSWAEKE